jgi:hypothetical protein
MSAVTQFYKAICNIGGNQYPVLPTAQFTMPKNFIIPPVIGNYWQWNFAEGFQQPSVDLVFLCRDKGSLGSLSEVLSTTFLNYWLTRTSDAAHDTTAIGSGVAFWDGRSGFTLGGAKAESFTLSGAKGQLLQFTGRFLFNSITPLGAAPSFTAWDNSAPLIGKNVTFDGNFANEAWNFGLSFANNHTPDMSMDGTNLPTDNNAGLMTAGLNVTAQAALLTFPDNNPVPGSLTAINITITGANGTRVFTINNPINQTPNNRAVPLGRVMRQHSYVAIGGNGQTTPPLSIS